MKKSNAFDWLIIIFLIAAMIVGIVVDGLRDEPLGNGSLNGYPM